MRIGGGGRTRERRGEAKEESQAHREPDGKREKTKPADEEALTPVLPGRSMHLVQIEAQECPRRRDRATHRQGLSLRNDDVAAEDREIPFDETGRRKRDGASPDDHVPRDARGDAHVRQDRDDAARYGLLELDVSRKSRLPGRDRHRHREQTGSDHRRRSRARARRSPKSTGARRNRQTSPRVCSRRMACPSASSPAGHALASSASDREPARRRARSGARAAAARLACSLAEIPGRVRTRNPEKNRRVAKRHGPFQSAKSRRSRREKGRRRRTLPARSGNPSRIAGNSPSPSLPRLSISRERTAASETACPQEGQTRACSEASR